MATITKQFTFTPGTAIQSSEVNANFNQLFSAYNDSVIHRDGSRGMTGVLLLPGLDPTNVNHATRKQYVDARDEFIRQQAVSAARAQWQAGLVSGTTNSAGDMVFAHGLGATPKACILTPASGGTHLGWTVSVENLDDINVNARFFSTDGGAFVPNTPFAIYYWVGLP